MQFWEQDLAEIRETLLVMSGLTERNLANALRAVAERDFMRADRVINEDSQIDALEIAMDELVVTYMSTHGPVARDCRLMLVAVKISRELERIADKATSIAKRGNELTCMAELPPIEGLHNLGSCVQEMVRDAISAFIHGDEKLALEVISRDRQVDAEFREIRELIVAAMQAEPKAIPAHLATLAIAKAIERIGDHATNIAEEAHFLVSGRDIRHGHAAGA